MVMIKHTGTQAYAEAEAEAGFLNFKFRNRGL